MALPPALDPIEVAKVVAGLVLSQHLAGVVGPYSAIILASVLGAGASLTNAPSMGRASTCLFFLRGCGAAILFTVPLSSMAATRFENWDAQWFFIPMAVVIGYSADKGKQIATVVSDTLKSWLRGWANKGTDR